MSHNNTTVNAQKPDRDGVVTQALADLSDVSGTPANNDLLQYDSSTSSWSSASVASSSAIEYIFWGRGESEAYSDSPATALSAGSTIYIYDSAGANTISGASITSTTSTGAGGGEWLESVTLPAGTYRIIMACSPSFSSSGGFSFALFNSGGTRNTAIGVVGANPSSPAGPISSAIVNYTTSTTLNAEVTNATGVDSIANQGNTMSQTTTLLIEKLA